MIKFSWNFIIFLVKFQVYLDLSCAFLYTKSVEIITSEKAFQLMELYYHTMISYFYKKPTKIQEWIKMARTKNTHAFQSDIKHYDKIRDILRYLYMYGSSSKEELVEKKLSKSISSFYDTKQRIENYIDGEYLQEHKSKEKGSGKKYRFMYDPFICPVNYLADTYQNCSYVIDDFIFYFCLMQTFTDPDFRQKPYEYASNCLLYTSPSPRD